MNAAWLSDTVCPRSEPATSAAYTGCGSRFWARRWATATDSNQGFCFQGFSSFTSAPGRHEPGERALGAVADRRPGHQLEHHRLVAGRVGLGVVLAGGREHPVTGRERGLAVPLHALGVRP